MQGWDGGGGGQYVCVLLLWYFAFLFILHFCFVFFITESLIINCSCSIFCHQTTLQVSVSELCIVLLNEAQYPVAPNCVL